MPLEQFSGQTTTASDLYSLGMTIIYLLTGNHPSELVTFNGQVKFTAEISNRFRRWLEKTTQPYLEKRFDSARLAQIALRSEDGSYGDFVHLKPANTKVQLYRDRDRLEIIWQDIDREKVERIDTIAAIPGHLINWLSLLCFISLFLSIIGSWILYLGLFSFSSIFTIAFFISPLSIFAAAIIKCFIPEINYKLVINEQYIYYCKYQSQSQKSKILSQHLRSQIEILAYNPGYIFDKCLDSKGNVVQGSNITVPPKLYLYCGDTEYHVLDRLSQAEFWWLGQELSDFLNLELQIIYPTPELPAAPTSCGGGC